MALDLEVESLDSLDDSIKGLYTESEGKFRLDISGGVPDVSGLKSALASERELAKKAKAEAKAAAARLEGIDLDKYQAIMSKFENDEELKLIAEGKTDEVWNRRKEKNDAAWQAKLEAESLNAKKAQETIKQLKKRALQGELSLGFGDTFHEYARPDAIRVALDMFTLDDDGKAVMLDENGSIVIGKDGKTPFSVQEWATSPEVRNEHPHWFKPTGSGSGAFQTTNNSGNGRTITRSQYEALSPAEQRASYKAGVEVIDD